MRLRFPRATALAAAVLLGIAAAPSRGAPPAIASLTPGAVPAGARAFLLTVEGTGFSTWTVVDANGEARPTVAEGATRLGVYIPAVDVASPGVVRLVARDPAGVSNAATLIVLEMRTPQSAANPAPLVTGLEPWSVASGAPGLTLTVRGAGFSPGSLVLWNGLPRATTYAGPGRLTASLWAADLSTTAAAVVAVRTPPPGGGVSNGAVFAVENGAPVPWVFLVSPATAAAGAPGAALVLTGMNFSPGAAVLWNGQPRPTVFVSTAQLTAALPASDLVSAGTAAVTVFNPPPGGGTSPAAGFMIVGPYGATGPPPTLTALLPPSAEAGSAGFSLDVLGAGFAPGSQLYWNGYPRPTAYATSSRLTASVYPSDVAQPGLARLVVVAPGGASSSTMTYLVGGDLSAAAPAPEAFVLRDAYAFPNPARGGGTATFRVQAGLPDSLEVRVYDLAGRRVHQSADFAARGALDAGNGLGPQLTFDHAWDLSGVASGVYEYVLVARKAGLSDLTRTGKVGIVK